eukprot:gb/GECH01014625.1/.p1 GENE.gb/GECH01014625.1/~~gb/GECH01014625.1/.p1  ORF type:complete len:297 (+),score=78.08 gb/GECH01014625.1/:1-891(+)
MLKSTFKSCSKSSSLKHSRNFYNNIKKQKTRFFSSFEEVKISRDTKNDSIAILTLDRPEKLNALTVPMKNDFENAISEIRNDSSIRAVVLTGAGKAFSAGGDLDFLTERSNDTPYNNALAMRDFYRGYLGAVRSLAVPVLSAINGHAIGAGLCLAMTTDIRVAASDAKLGLTFTQLGLHPGMGATHFLPQLIGYQAASYMLLTGATVNGGKAKEMGLVLEAKDDSADVLPRTLEMARDIAANPKIAVNTCHHSLRMQQNEMLERALQREADAQAQSYADQALHDRVSAMKDKAKKK